MKPHQLKYTLAKGMLTRWLTTLFILALVLTFPAQAKSAMLSLPGGQVPQSTDETLATWLDDFNAAALDPAWSWINEDPTNWSLTELPGYLRIYASALGTGGENLLLRAVAEGDFSIETQMLFEPFADFQFAGLVIYQDADNFLQLGRAFCSPSDSCVGNGIYFDKVQDGDLVDGDFATPVNNTDEAFLRLERRGDQVRGLFSYEGITWFEIGTHVLPAGFTVNGVGLTASQDLEPPAHDLPADFNYFELNEETGFLPEGYHDYSGGVVPNLWGNCAAGGWAVDPDDLATDIQVEIVIDEVVEATLPASDYRQDLEDSGVCIDGTCSFHVELWELMSSYESHIVAVNAQDSTTGEWVQLKASPKELTCSSYDIYIYDTLDDSVTQITDLRDSSEFNPRWSPDGTRIIHDRWDFDWNNLGIHVTDVASGVSTPLAGAENGNYPFWSPDGNWIIFSVDDADLYKLPAAGGTPTLVRSDAYRGVWSPDGLRLAFNQPSDNSIRTMDPDGSDVTLVAADGNSPAWSPDGMWIAYEDSLGDIYKVAVDSAGAPLSSPVQLTNESYWEGRASWSADSQTVYYHAGLDDGNFTDIWSVPAGGGRSSWVTGSPELGDYDPNVSPDGRYISYASLSDAGQAARSWGAAFSFYLPAGSLVEGTYPYHFELEWSSPDDGTYTGQDGEFVVSASAPLYEKCVLLRGFKEQASVDVEGGFECIDVTEINPDQPVRFLIGWITDYEMTYADAAAHFDSMLAQVFWGVDSSAVLVQHEIFPFPLDNIELWADYACEFTRNLEPAEQVFLPLLKH